MRVVPEILNESAFPMKDDIEADIINLSNAKETQKPNLEQLLEFIKRSHPYKANGKQTSFCETISLPTGSHGCICGDTSPKSGLDKYGLAVTLYFRFVKNLAQWFFLFSILSVIPLVFYVRSYLDASSSEDYSVSEKLLSTTIGSLVIDSTKCQYLSLSASSGSTNNLLQLSCGTGLLSSKASKYTYGLVSSSTSSSNSCLFLDSNDIDQSCNQPSSSSTSFDSFINPCLGTSSCLATISASVFLSSPVCTQALLTKDIYITTICEEEHFDFYYTFKKESLVIIFSIIDAFFLLGFMIFLLRLKVSEKQAEKAVMSNSLSASHFALEIQNLPQNLSKSQLKFGLQKHLEQMGSLILRKEQIKVHDIQFAQPHKTIQLQKKFKDLQAEKARIVLQFCHVYAVEISKEETVSIQELMYAAKSNKLTKEQKQAAEKELALINKIIRKIEAIQDNILIAQEYRKEEITAAWVTFETMRMRDIAYSLLYRTNFDRLLDSLCCCFGSSSDSRRFEGKMLRISSAPQPENIIWANLDLSLFSKIARRAFSLIVTLVFLFGTLVLIVYVKKVNQDFISKYPSSICPSTSSSITTAQVVLDYESAAPKGLLECYCKVDTLGRLHDVFVLSSGKTKTLCNDWFSDRVLILLLPFAIVLAIIVINQIMEIIFIVLSKIEGHKYVSGEVSSRVVKIFFMQFMNTALIILIMNMKFASASSSGFSFLLSGSFKDFIPLWFKNVGTTILLTILFYLITPYLNFFALKSYASLRRWYDRHFQANLGITRQHTQSDYEQVYLGPRFLIETRYAQLMNIVFVSLFYSTGLPLLISTTFFYLVSTYFIDKVMMFRFCRTPPNYTKELEKSIRTICWIVVPLHCILSVWMLGSSKLFAGTSQFELLSFISDSINDYYTPTSTKDYSIQELMKRAIKVQSLPQLFVFIIFAVIILYFLLKKQVLKPLLKVLCCCLRLSSDDLVSSKNVLQLIPFYAFISREDLWNEIESLKKEINESVSPLTVFLEEKLRLYQREHSLRKQSKNQVAQHLENQNINCTLVGLYSYDILNNPDFQ